MANKNDRPEINYRFKGRRLQLRFGPEGAKPLRSQVAGFYDGSETEFEDEVDKFIGKLCYYIEAKDSAKVIELLSGEKKDEVLVGALTVAGMILTDEESCWTPHQRDLAKSLCTLTAHEILRRVDNHPVSADVYQLHMADQDAERDMYTNAQAQWQRLNRRIIRATEGLYLDADPDEDRKERVAVGWSGIVETLLEVFGGKHPTEKLLTVLQGRVDNVITMKAKGRVIDAVRKRDSEKKSLGEKVPLDSSEIALEEALAKSQRESQQQGEEVRLLVEILEKAATTKTHRKIVEDIRRNGYETEVKTAELVHCHPITVHRLIEKAKKEIE